MEQNAYSAFISYRHQSPDQEIAKALHTAIETYGIPTSVKKQTGVRRMGKVFRDQEELPLSADLGADIETALDNSEWFIAICSPRYLESRWCLRELEYFIAHKGREHVLTVLADGEPNESFPDAIRFVPNEDGTLTETEPLAANVRAATLKESLKKLKNEKLRILAPMLGLSFDDLKRRARKRRIRIACTVGAAVLVAAAGLTTFLLINHANSERLKREAEEQARIAAEQARLAEEQRLLAEEEQRRADEERRTAIYNDLGERMERVSIALMSGERREAAEIALSALTLSDENEQMRHDEIIDLLRRTMYIEPFTSVFSFNNQNMQMIYITPSPDGTRALGVVNSNAIAMIDLLQNKILYTVSVNNAPLFDPCFSADGTRFLASCDYGRFVQVWNTADGSEAFSYTSKQNRQYDVNNIFFWKDADSVILQDADRIYLVYADGTERLFYTYGEQLTDYDPTNNIISRLFNGKPLNEFFTEVNDGYSGIDLLLTADREKVVVTGLAGETAVIVLDSEGNRLFVPAAPGDPSCMMPAMMTEKWALSPDGRTLLATSFFGIIFGWDMDSGDMIILDGIETEGTRMPTVPVFTPDSERFAYTVDNRLYVCETRTNQMLITANLDSTKYVPTVSFSEDGNYLLMTNESMFIVNTETWALELTETAPNGVNYNALVSMGDMILAARYDGVITLYSTPALSSVQTVADFDAPLLAPYLPQRAVDCVPIIGEHQYSETFKTTSLYKNEPAQLYFSRDGSTVAMAYPDGAIELFDTQGDGRVKESIGQLYTYINTLALTENRLIAVDVDARLLVYNLDTHSVETILNNGTLYSSFAFSEDGSLMMALCAGLTKIDVFDLNDDCRLLFSLHATADTFTDFAFSADGAYAVGSTASGNFVVGDLFADEAKLLEKARAFTKHE